MTVKKRSLIAVISLSALLSGCGQKGPLFLPDAPPPQPTTTEPESEPKQN
ncbi:MAG: lipoprotein [Pseudomonadota bacterium]